MKNILCLFLLFCAIIQAGASVTIPANDPLIEYTGRIDFRDPLAPRFSYSGVSVRAAFKGTSISVNLRDDGSQNFYNVIIDGAVVKRIQTVAGLKTYPLVSSLADTIHEVELFKLTEVSFGKTQFCGFIIDDNSTLVPIANQRPRLIEYIGNSITCGYGNEGTTSDKFGPTTENHYLTYAAFTSRNFNARHLAVCRSGIGIYRNYGGPVEGNSDNMTNLYQRIFIGEATPLYDFAQQPDLVCIDLGTNDFSTSQGDSARYVSKYFELINTIQDKNNQADILCLLGPMMGGNDLIRVRKYLQFIADSASKRNNGKVYFFEMSGQTGNLGIGVDWHPTVAQHLQNSKELTAFISQLKGWPVEAYATAAAVTSADEITLTFNTPVKDPTATFTGFTVSSGDVGTLTITRTFLDATDKSKVHLVLGQNLTPQSILTISYKQGDLQTTTGEKVKDFSHYALTNKLNATSLTKATVDATGTRVTLTFNKNITLPTNSSLVSITNKQGTAYTIKNMSKATASSLLFLLNEKVDKTDTVFITAGSSIYGTDKVGLTPLDKFMATNLSLVTSINHPEALQCTLFPNPAINRMINYSISGNSKALKASLHSLQGKCLASYPLNANQGIINFNNLSILPGAYLLKISSLKEEYTAKIIL